MYWGDYLLDTAHFTTTEHGAYLLLIAFYWTNGGLPDTEDSIRKIAKCSVLAWRKILPRLKEKFTVTDAPCNATQNVSWKHKRIDIELAQAIEKSKVNSANAKRRRARSLTDSESESQREERGLASLAPAAANGAPPSVELATPQGPPPAAAKVYVLDLGEGMRVTQKDMAAWQRAFPNIDVVGELMGARGWLKGKGREWFFAASGLLAKHNREARSAREAKIEVEKLKGKSDPKTQMVD